MLECERSPSRLDRVFLPPVTATGAWDFREGAFAVNNRARLRCISPLAEVKSSLPVLPQSAISASIPPKQLTSSID